MSDARIAVYPGSFDPITTGHLDILERAVGMFDEVIIGIGEHATKPGFFPYEQRRRLAEQSIEHIKGARVVLFKGLVVEFCRAQGARSIVRGLRATGDFEPEFQMALANRELAPEVETVFLVPRADVMFVSSSLVREIASHGGKFEPYVTAVVAKAIVARLSTQGDV